jgi:hypothetical protein
MEEKHLTILGLILFDELNLHTDERAKETIQKIDAIKELTIDEAEDLIDEGTFDSYLMPDLWLSDIQILDTNDMANSLKLYGDYCKNNTAVKCPMEWLFNEPISADSY